MYVTNGTSCHVKDLCPFRGSHPLDDKGDTEDSEWPIYLGWVQQAIPLILVAHQKIPICPVRVPLRRKKSKWSFFGGTSKTKYHTCTVICVIWRSGGSVADVTVRNLNPIMKTVMTYFITAIKELIFGVQNFNVKRKQVHTGTTIFMHIDHMWPACFVNYERRAEWGLAEDSLHLRDREYYQRQSYFKQSNLV